MHPIHIKAELEMRGYNQSEVGRELKLAPNTVGYVIHGKGRSRKVEVRIAAILGKPLHEIWPQWYGKDGKPIRARRRPARLADTITRMAAAGAAAAAKR